MMTDSRTVMHVLIRTDRITLLLDITMLDVVVGNVIYGPLSYKTNN